MAKKEVYFSTSKNKRVLHNTQIGSEQLRYIKTVTYLDQI